VKVSLLLITNASTSSFHGGGQGEEEGEGEEEEEGREDGRITRRRLREGLIRKGGGGRMLAEEGEEEEGCRLCVCVCGWKGRRSEEG